MRSPILLAAGLLATTQAVAQEKPVLTVMTYDSFVSDWGPGPAVETAFEKICTCDLQFVAAGDGAALLARVRLEGARSEADVVLGLDTNLTAAADDTGLFAPHGIDDLSLSLPVEWDDPTFLPYDWGYFAFVHDAALKDVPADFRMLGDSDTTIVVQDPRSSTPGLGLLLWVKSAYGDDAPAIWEALADNIVTVTPGWSEAYGLFLEGEADMVLSYTTSPAYHLIAEEDESKTAAAFDEGHYMQIEVAGVLAASDQPE
ncbi:MAG: thiamine ABC transporter substrate-binding protein, partial [Silicimonas sp.]|nr:thiamine ABC transporter substrate-binding protein [Silicimonas sp.]